ncbi:ATP-binding protein [Polyangium aurulentum]|uniref:ATP-binding protein n=1 Tax=Polyangium aurulentum TaxID=2567896 RepID=UPI0010AEE983|nr:ATP-binding protein [Polyangium aurulentum]UQA57681.1 hypothetical protein E8A73_041440 [Polyangium aurulentum]
MSLSVSHLSLVALGYLALLFLLAHLAERGAIPARIVRHPLLYAVSLGAYATSWTYYGSVGFAEQHGLTFLAVYLGPTLACIAIPAVWLPILRLARDHQLASLADLFAFRYRGRRVGVAITLLSLVASVPYIAQQIRAVDGSVRALSPSAPTGATGLGFAALVVLFTVLFGARHLTARERHDGLAVAVAFESIVKLFALLAVGAAALFGVLGGPGALGGFLDAHPEVFERLAAPVREGTGYGALLLISFGAAFLLPRQFHLAFAEGATPRALRFAAFAFPLFLLLLNLPILPVLWAGARVAGGASPDAYVLEVPRALGSAPLALVAFVGGISAASAMIIVTTIALAGMCLNHLVLPAQLEILRQNPYARLLWLRRALVAAIIFTGYAFDRFQERGLLVAAGLASFVAFAQLLPGLFGLLFWKRATRTGLLAGLAGGMIVWTVSAFLPLLARTGFVPSDLFAAARASFGLHGADTWTLPTIVSLSLNAALFGLVSLATEPAPGEADAARLCAREALVATPSAGALRSPRDLRRALARTLGDAAAEAEIARSLGELAMSEDETRPGELRRLGDQVEKNLSGLFGPVLARLVVHPEPSAAAEDTALADQLRFLDERLGRAAPALTGVAAELDLLRRYLRTVLDELPIGVCALGPDRDVILWNRAMERTTALAPLATTGLTVDALPAPFGPALATFARDEAAAEADIDLSAGGRRLAIRLHKAQLDTAALGDARAPRRNGLVLLVEDRTERAALEAQLVHKDRLASVGRLAAGVAHEIGNPLTGITCLAQNLAREANGNDELQGRADLILAQAGRIEGIVRSLLGYSREGATASGGPPLPRVERTLIAPAVDEAMALVRLDRTGKLIQMDNVCPSDLAVLADRQRLTQVLVNLLTNACDASAPGGAVLVDATRAPEGVLLRVIDGGAGIAPELKERVFEPFFTTKPPAEGTGLGLSVVYGIVEEHGGRVWIESEPGCGTTVLVRLPIAAEPGETA